MEEAKIKKIDSWSKSEDGVYTFVVGVEDVVIEAVANKELAESGCSSTMSVGFAAVVALCGAAWLVGKRRKKN